MTQIEPVPYSLLKGKDKDPLSVICATMDRFLEDENLEIPNEILSVLIEEIKCKL